MYVQWLGTDGVMTANYVTENFSGNEALAKVTRVRE